MVSMTHPGNFPWKLQANSEMVWADIRWKILKLTACSFQFSHILYKCPLLLWGLWTVCVLYNSYIGFLFPNVMEFGGRVLERYLSHEGEAFMNRIDAFLKGIPESCLTLSLLCADATSWQLANRAESSPEPDHAGTWALNFQTPEQWKIKFCCS